MNIHIDIKEKKASLLDKNIILVCGNSGYIFDFTFDEEWSGHPVKTARFIWNGQYEDRIFEGNSCEMPIIHDADYVAIGVFSGNLKTTTPVILRLWKSILSEDPIHVDPPEDIYNQIMDLLNNMQPGYPIDIFPLDGEYLYDAYYDVINYDMAKEYFKIPHNDSVGACTAVRKGNFVGRNFDWIYNEHASFIVKTSKVGNRLASIGVTGGGLPELTKEFVDSKVKSESYYILPFMIVDGINEAGVFVEINVVPTDKEPTTITIPTEEKRDEICTRMLPRYILDHYISAEQAVDDIIKHIAIYPAQELLDMNYELHFLICDRVNSYILEIWNNEIHVKWYTADEVAIMTNFHVTDIFPNDDGSVYTPEIQGEEHSAMRTNGITAHGSGLERWNFINDTIDLVENKEHMNALMECMYYTNAYKDSTVPFWYSELVHGDLTVDSSLSDFAEIKSIAQMYFENRSRDPESEFYGTWHTAHSTVYDIFDKSFTIISQENGVLYTVVLDSFLTEVHWADILGKPETFPPSEHYHDDRYYTKERTDEKIGNEASIRAIADESLQTAVNSKLTKPQNGIEEGKYFKISGFDSDGNPVLEAVDLQEEGFVKNADYATDNKGGVIKASSTYAVQVNSSSGDIIASNISKDDFADLADNAFISKATLENLKNAKYLVGSDYVDEELTDYQTSEDNNLQTEADTIVGGINEVNSIAKQANKALGVLNYLTLVTMLNGATAEAYNIGQSIYIQTLDVPDIWIYSVESTNVPYTYVDDATLVETLASNVVQIGYYKIARLETQKVDLTNYVKNTDYPSSTVGGVLKLSSNQNTKAEDGTLMAIVRTLGQYDSAPNASFIGKGTLENILPTKVRDNAIFVAEYNTTLHSDILSAYQSGKRVFARRTLSNGNVLTLPLISVGASNQLYFASIVGQPTTYYSISCYTNNTWEFTTNTTDASLSSSSANSGKPTSKAVYDFALPKNQGTSNAGKALAVNPDGNVEPIETEEADAVEVVESISSSSTHNEVPSAKSVVDYAVSKNQGVSNAGKSLVVGADGNVVQKNNKLELLDTITLAGNETEFTKIYQDLDAVIVIANGITPSDTTAYRVFNVYTYSGNGQTVDNNVGGTHYDSWKSTAYVIFRNYKNCGMWQSYRQANTGKGAYNTGYSLGTFGQNTNLESDYPYINQVVIRFSVPPVEGGVIQIYGIKA